MPLPSGPVAVRSWTAVAALGLLGSAVALMTFYTLIAEAGPTRAGLVTYFHPVVAVALGIRGAGRAAAAGPANRLRLDPGRLRIGDPAARRAAFRTDRAEGQALPES
jgi:hypothetical protein